MAFRRHTIRLDAQALTPTPSGGLRVERARLARTGLQTYQAGDGVIVEYRDSQEVFSAESLASYRDATLTILRHPADDVTPDNWRDLAHGHVAGAAVQAGDWVEAPVVISSREAVDAVKRGDLVELSCGYETDLVHEPGEYQGQKYDARQTNIRINHLTLLSPGRARAGRDARLVMDAGPERVRRLDANGDEVVDDDVGPEARGETQMKHKVKRDGVTVEVEGDAAAGQVLGLIEDDLAKAKKDATDEKVRADAAERKRDEYKTALDAATDPAKVSAAIKARVALVDEAVLLGCKRDELEPLSDRDVRLKALGASFKADAQTPEAEIAGAFRFAASKAKERKEKDGHRDALDDTGHAIHATLTDEGEGHHDELTELLDELDDHEADYTARVRGLGRDRDDEDEED